MKYEYYKLGWIWGEFCNYSGVQGKNNAYYNFNKIKNHGIYE
jgi:hypothetical protein